MKKVLKTTYTNTKTGNKTIDYSNGVKQIERKNITVNGKKADYLGTEYPRKGIAVKKGPNIKGNYTMKKEISINGKKAEYMDKGNYVGRNSKNVIKMKKKGK